MKSVKNSFPTLSVHTQYTVCILGVTLLFFPKLNIFQIGSETAGIRIDDLLLGGFLLFLSAATLLSRRTSLTKLELFFALFVAEGLVSNLLNNILYGRSSILYSLRLLEYFLFFYIGYYFFVSNSIIRLARWVLAANGAAIMLQLFGIIGAATSEGVVTSVQERPVGLTGGPWEVGAIINFCFSILVFEEEKRLKVRQVLLLFVISLALILITGSRMALIAHLFLLVSFLYKRLDNLIHFTAVAVVTASVAIGAIVVIPTHVTSRSENLFTIENFRSFQSIYDNTPDDPETGGLASFSIEGGGDLSWLVRSAKWAAAIKGWKHNASSLLFGIGPGAMGPSLDGGWLRVLSEAGVLGLIVFVIFWGYVFRSSNWNMRGVLIALAVNMLMIDIHIAYKAMSFIFFSLGYFYHRKCTESREEIHKGLPISACSTQLWMIP